MVTMMKRFMASIVGLAVGDALGYPAEFRTRQKIMDTFPPNGLVDFVGIQDPRWTPPPYILGNDYPPGTYTDDTQMSLCVAQALLETGHADVETIMQYLSHLFVEWSLSPSNDRAPGGTCMTGCENLQRGIPWHQAGVARSKGCGSAMRVAPIGLFYCKDKIKLLEVARASSLLTHGHDAAIEGAAASALLVAMALEGHTPQAMYQAIMETCAPHSNDFRTCLEKLPGLLSEPPHIALSKQGLGEAWVAEEAVASALYCFWKHPDDFAAAVLMGANTDGDSDTIACITGSITGAALGLDAIPSHWRQQVEDSQYLHKMGQKLWEQATLPFPADTFWE